jgi:hypothetical protein
VTETSAKREARESGDADESRHGTDTVEINLGLCRYGGADEPATQMAVRKDGTGWIGICDEHVGRAEEDGFEVRDGSA